MPITKVGDCENKCDEGSKKYLLLVLSLYPFRAFLKSRRVIDGCFKGRVACLYRCQNMANREYWRLGNIGDFQDWALPRRDGCRFVDIAGSWSRSRLHGHHNAGNRNRRFVFVPCVGALPLFPSRR